MDDKGNVVGVSDVDRTMRDIRDIIRDQILPSTEGLCEIGSLFEGDKIVVFVKVAKGDKLYYIKKEGRSASGCFYRDGTSSVVMSEQAIERKFRESCLTEKTMVEVASHQTDFSFTQLKIYYAGQGYHLSDDTFEKNLHLRNSSGKYNLLAELLSDTNRMSLKVVKFQGKDKSVLIQRSEYGDQCLLTAINRVMDRLEAENITLSTIAGVQRADTRLVDMASLREVFINAIAHNDWTIVEPAVYIFSDRFEVISHGGLPAGETEEMFFQGVSTPRNKELMRILSDLNFVEQSGHGIPEVLKHYGRDIFQIHDKYINVAIPFAHEINSALSNGRADGRADGRAPDMDRSEYVLKYLKENPFATMAEIAKLLGLSVSSARRVTNKLKEEGRLSSERSNQHGTWKVIDKKSLP